MTLTLSEAEIDDIDASDTSIEIFCFNQDGQKIVSEKPKGVNWPVVYLIYGKKEIYIGETSNASKRFSEHLNNPVRTRSLKSIGIVFDDTFNKSAILDIEQSLIHLFNADQRFVLQNRNAGQSSEHNYYHREFYARKVQSIWNLLCSPKYDLAHHEYMQLLNSDLFKYSPYISLTPEQNDACYAVLEDVFCRKKIDEPGGGTFLITGAAGTGKTIVAINIISRIVDAMQHLQDPIDNYEFSEKEDRINNELHRYIKSIHENKGKELKIGFVVPMKSMRKTLKKVFNATKNGLGSRMIIGPHDVFKEDYDILISDESHRLTRRNNLVMKEWEDFDDKCNRLKLDPSEATALDWIIMKSRYRIIFYDENQSIRGSDLLPEQFQKSIGEDYSQYTLHTQMRCDGGTTYVNYINDIFNCNQTEFVTMKDYTFQLFDDIGDMIKEIHALDAEMGLCRTVAGYAWEWKTKNMKFEKIIEQNLQDVVIGDYRYPWNTCLEGWVLSKHSVDEIGCVHTVQGFDLNYVGVIIGKDVDYDPIKNEIIINKDNFYDARVKRSLPDNQGIQLKKYIINSYKVLLTRGIKGCFVYVCNPELKKYLNRFVPTVLK